MKQGGVLRLYPVHAQLRGGSYQGEIQVHTKVEGSQCPLNKTESLLDANIAKSIVSSLLILTDDWGV